MIACIYCENDLAKEILLNNDVIATRQNKITKQNAFMLACVDEPMSDVCKIIFEKMLGSSQNIMDDLTHEDKDGLNILDHSLIYLQCDDNDLMQYILETYIKYDLIQYTDNILSTKSAVKTPILFHLIKWLIY